MSDLYTSLTRMKQSLNNGDLPPMTPLTDAARRVIDPEYTIGMGALCEDQELGLRCPVRGCGEWHHNLGTHIQRKHKAIGGVDGVRAALDIPQRAGLVSQDVRGKLSASMARTHSRRPEIRAHMTRLGKRIREEKVSPRASRGMLGERNFRNRCVAQLQARLLDLANRLGRAPIAREAAAEWGEGAARDIQKVFGSWNAALAAAGIADRQKGCRVDMWDALETIKAWYAAHGELPSADVLNNGGCTPYLMSRQTYMRLLDTDSWPEAMRRAATLLQIYGGRYGIPVEHKPRQGAA